MLDAHETDLTEILVTVICFRRWKEASIKSPITAMSSADWKWTSPLICRQCENLGKGSTGTTGTKVALLDEITDLEALLGGHHILSADLKTG
jgi:hypothetical protein